MTKDHVNPQRLRLHAQGMHGSAPGPSLYMMPWRSLCFWVFWACTWVDFDSYALSWAHFLLSVCFVQYWHVSFYLSYILFKRKENEISMKTSHWNSKVNYLQSNLWPSTNLICYTTVMLISVQIVVREVFWGRKSKARREEESPFSI